MLGWFAGPLAAQQAGCCRAAPAAQPSTAIDASKLPLNLSKLSAETEGVRAKPGDAGLTFNGRRHRPGSAHSDLHAWGGLRYGPVPNTPARRMQEMIEIATPREFRSPVMDFSNLMRWVQSTLKREN